MIFTTIIYRRIVNVGNWIVTRGHIIFENNFLSFSTDVSPRSAKRRKKGNLNCLSQFTFGKAMHMSGLHFKLYFKELSSKLWKLNDTIIGRYSVWLAGTEQLQCMNEFDAWNLMGDWLGTRVTSNIEWFISVLKMVN